MSLQHATAHTGSHPAPTAGQAGGPAYEVVGGYQGQTNRAASVVRSELSQVGGSFPAQTQQQAATAVSELGLLGPLRKAATGTDLDALVVVQKYTNLIDKLLVLEDATPQGASDPTLSQDVRVLGLISHAKEDASEQRATLTQALIQGNLSPNAQKALENASSDQAANLGEFTLSATPGQLQQFNNAGAGSTGYLASADEQAAIALAHSLSSDTTTAARTSFMESPDKCAPTTPESRGLAKARQALRPGPGGDGVQQEDRRAGRQP
jgi:hypothetical protein